MKTPFEYKLTTETHRRSTLRKRRATHDCRISYAKLQLIHSDGLHIIKQGFSGYTFYIEQSSFCLSKATTLQVTVKEDCLVFAYMIKGTLSFRISDSPEEMALPAGRSFIQTIPKGTYSWDVPKGKMKGVYFMLRPEWMLKMKSEYPDLVETIEKLYSGEITYQAFLPQVISLMAVRQLRKMRECKLTGRIELEEYLLHAICKLVAECHGYLASPDPKPAKTNREKILEVRDHIIEVVGKGTIPHVTDLSDWCFMEPKALRRNCLKIFRMSVKDLILDAQMKRGHGLLTKGLKAKEVAAMLGYTEHTNFTRTYKMYFGYTPNQFSQHLIEAYS